MLKTDFYNFYLPNNGKYNLAGRYLIADNLFVCLEDYYDLLKDLPNGFMDEYSDVFLQRLKQSNKAISHTDLQNGMDLDLIPEESLLQPLSDTGAQPEKRSVPVQFTTQPNSNMTWEYHRTGYPNPVLLESHMGRVLMNGNPLQDDEVQTILQNIQNGVGKITYLGKAEMDPEAALAHLSKLHSNDPHTKAMVDALRAHVFTDPVTGLGNKYANQKFREKGHEGVHIGLDMNGLKQINDVHGHDAGDQAIKGFGEAIRQASDKVGGGKFFRTGGDEVSGHFDTHEQASEFARHLRNHLDAHPAIGGTHKLSTSIGFGNSPEHADKALYHAKAAKYAHVKETGANSLNTPSFAHSLVSGHEGAVPLHDIKPKAPTATSSPKLPKITHPVP